jgi:hypothetical protein
MKKKTSIHKKLLLFPLFLILLVPFVAFSKPILYHPQHLFKKLNGVIKGCIHVSASLPPPHAAYSYATLYSQLFPNKNTHAVTLASPRSIYEVFVYLNHVSGYFHPPANPATIIIHDNHFAPEILPVLAGGFVKFENLDFRNYKLYFHSYLDNYRFTRSINLNKSISQKMWKPQFIKVTLKSHLLHFHHAYIFVVQNPYFDICSLNQYYHIDHVPPGHYVLTAWSYYWKTFRKSIDIHSGKNLKLNITFTKVKSFEKP